MIRTTLLAALWGTSAYGDIFFLAFKIPNLLRRFFAEGAMSAAFIPLFSKLKSASENEEHHSAPPPLAKQEFYFTIFWLLGMVMILIVLLGIAGAEHIASFLFILQDLHGFNKVEETTLLLKILFPYIGFISLCSLQQAVLENYGRFAYSASVPILFNLVMITAAAGVLLEGDGILKVVTALGLLKEKGNLELAETIVISLGAILGGGFQFGYAYYGVRRLGYRIFSLSSFIEYKNQINLYGKIKKLRNYFSHPTVKKFLFLLLPVFLSSGSYQIQILLTEPISLSLGEGAVSTLYYANRLLEFPLGIVGVAITAASLPRLSRAAQDPQGEEDFFSLIRYSLNTVAILFFPILIVSFFYPRTIIAIVFEFNRFTQEDTSNTALTFLALIPSLFSLAGYRILFNGFYARENTRTPLLITSINLFLGVPLAYLLTRYYPHPFMIALSFTVSSYVMLGVALHLHSRKKVSISLWGFFGERVRFFLKVGLVVLPLVYIIHRLIDPVFRVLEEFADHLLVVKLINLAELAYFSLWVFAITLGVMILFREPQVMKFIPSLRNRSY